MHIYIYIHTYLSIYQSINLSIYLSIYFGRHVTVWPPETMDAGIKETFPQNILAEVLRILIIHIHTYISLSIYTYK